MRPTTIVFALLESKGKPDHTEQFEGSVQQLARSIAVWLLRVEMGHKLQITVGRTLESISQSSSRKDSEDELLAQLEDIFNSTDSLESAEEPN